VRSRVTEEIRGHLTAAAAEYREVGYGARKAERKAVRDLGDPKKVRVDLGRSWHGRRVVLFPKAPRDYLEAFLIYDLKAILMIVAVVVLLRWQVVAAYRIPSKSMEPTLHGAEDGGDKILVNKLYYRFHRPERWQIAVFWKEGQPENLIKRIVGLAGETLDIKSGDVYIDGRIAEKPRDVQDDLVVPVFLDNQDLLAVEDGDEDAVGLDAWEATGDWVESEGVYVCDAGSEDPAYLGWSRPIRDDYPGGFRHASPFTVGDLVVRFRITPGKGTAVVGAELRENEDSFEVRLPVGDGERHAALLRNREEVVRIEGHRLEPGVEVEIRFANLDDRITLEVNGEEVISWPIPDPSQAVTNEEMVAKVGFQGGVAEIRGLSLFRDIYYYRKDYRRELPAKIPENGCFMLGDNSSTSLDSRAWGSVPASQLIGRPMVVFWPPSRMKVVR
jgi:signal peptidase I